MASGIDPHSRLLVYTFAPPVANPLIFINESPQLKAQKKRLDLSPDVFG